MSAHRTPFNTPFSTSFDIHNKRHHDSAPDGFWAKVNPEPTTHRTWWFPRGHWLDADAPAGRAGNYGARVLHGFVAVRSSEDLRSLCNCLCCQVVELIGARRKGSVVPHMIAGRLTATETIRGHGTPARSDEGSIQFRSLHGILWFTPYCTRVRLPIIFHLCDASATTRSTSRARGFSG
jgi:hypothetical protein